LERLLVCGYVGGIARDRIRSIQLIRVAIVLVLVHLYAVRKLLERILKCRSEPTKYRRG